MTQLNFARDSQGFNAYAPQQSNVIYSATLSASTAESITVPSTYERWVAYFSFNPAVSVWVSINNIAAVPAGATLASTTSQRNPSQLRVYAGDTISVICATASTDVSISLYNTD